MRVRPSLWLPGIVALSLALASGALTIGHEWGDDFAAYILQAQSLSKGTTDEFVERNGFTIRESSFQIGPVVYPWGYPLMLVPALVVKGVHPLALKVPGLFCFAGFLVCLYWMAIGRLPRTESLLLVALFAFSPVFIGFADQVLSDVPLLFVTILGLAWIGRRRGTVWSSVGLGAVIFMACLIRATGILLLAAFLADQALRFWRQREARREILVHSAVVVLAFAMPWMLTSLVLPPGEGSYSASYDARTKYILKGNPSYYFSLLGTFLGSGPAWDAAYYGVIALFLIGLWTRRQEDGHIAIFFVSFLGLMLGWPHRQGLRYIFPLVPIFMYMAFQGARFVIGRLPEGRQPVGRAVSNGLWLVLLASFLFGSGVRVQENLAKGRQVRGPFDPQSSGLFDYIRRETPADSVVVFFKPRAMRLLTNRDSVMLVTCQRLTIGDYVAVSKTPEIGQVQPDRIGQCGLPLKQVFENESFVVYALRQDAVGQAPARTP